ncbi:unnamed protein product, partial [Iphiclides podalirius]
MKTSGGVPTTSWRLREKARNKNKESKNAITTERSLLMSEYLNGTVCGVLRDVGGGSDRSRFYRWRGAIGCGAREATTAAGIIGRNRTSHQKRADRGDQAFAGMRTIPT